MNNNNILALAFLVAGALLTTTAITTIVPAAYADNKQRAEDNSAAAIADCDDNDVDFSDFLCISAAVNDLDLDLGGEEEIRTAEETDTDETDTDETGIMSNPLFNLGQNSTG